MEHDATGVPPERDVLRSFSTSKVSQLRPARTFENASVTVCALSVHDASDAAIVRLITSNSARTRHRLLQRLGPFAGSVDR